MAAREKAQQERDQKAFFASDKGAAAVDAANAAPDADKVEAALKATSATPGNKPGKVLASNIATQVPPTPVIASTKPSNKPVKVGEVVGK
jgi:hypothetical protein